MGIGNKIAEVRKQHHWTQAKLAEVSGLSTSAIAMYETNRRQPDEQTLSLLAKALGVTPRQFQTGDRKLAQKVPITDIAPIAQAPVNSTMSTGSSSTAEAASATTTLNLTRDEAKLILFLRMNRNSVAFLQGYIEGDQKKRDALEKAWRLIHQFQV